MWGDPSPLMNNKVSLKCSTIFLCNRTLQNLSLSRATNVTIAIIFPILFVGTAFVLGIIEYSPQNSQAFLQSLVNTKEEIIDLSQGRITIEESFDKLQTKIDNATQQSNKKINNVIKYAKIKVAPSSNDESKPDFDFYEIERIIHDLTNQQRVNNGLSPLTFDSEISEIARAHSLDMSNRGYFSHQTPEGLVPTDRADKAGYSCSKRVGIMIYSGIAENIFQGNLYDSYYTVNGIITSYSWNTNEDIAKITVDGWMDSQGHRKNILTEMFDREGIGVVISADDKVYITQNFC